MKDERNNERKKRRETTFKQRDNQNGKQISK